MGRQARQHPFDVAVQDRQPKIEGTGEDAACSGAADARQRHPLLQAAGPRPTNQQLRRLMQPAGPRVVTKALPLQPPRPEKPRPKPPGQETPPSKRVQ